MVTSWLQRPEWQESWAGAAFYSFLWAWAPCAVPLQAQAANGGLGQGGGGPGSQACTQGRIDEAATRDYTWAKEENGLWGRKWGVSFLCYF